MKNLFFILFFIPFISYCQNGSEFILQKSLSFERGNNCITNNDCFSLSPDIPNNISRTIFYTYVLNGNKQTIDTIYYAHIYGLTLSNFKNENENSNVVFLKIEDEYVPTFFIYYIKYGKLMKIGEWIIAIPYIKYGCEYCDYSIEDIRIHQRNDEIVFSFLKDMRFVVMGEHYNDYDDWGTFEEGKLKVSFNIADGSLKVIDDL